MKKCRILLVAAAMIVSCATYASAIDFKAKGVWFMSFDYGGGSKFATKDRYTGKRIAGYGGAGGNPNSADNFSAAQRLRLQLDAVASEALSGTVYFEIGGQTWGKAAQGAALGADGTVVKVKNAYLDWVIPKTSLKMRMGLQGIALPAMATGASPILHDDVAGIVASYKFNDTASVTGMWVRPYNDNFTAVSAGNSIGNPNAPTNFMDNMDLFGLLAPLKFSGVKMTPWVMVGAIGPNTFRKAGNYTYKGNANAAEFGNAMAQVVPGMLPAVYADHKGSKKFNTNYSSVFWAGFTGAVTAFDPWTFAWDFNYGATSNDISALNRAGWFGTLLTEYKLDWATPGLYAWYSSGDDSNVKNGSETMPFMNATGNDQYSNFGIRGGAQIMREGVIGFNLMGTWGIGARLKNFSFLEDLQHTLRVNYYGGTNSPAMAKYILSKDSPDSSTYTTSRIITDFNDRQKGLYLTTQDSAMEFGLSNSYKIYDNLTMYLEMDYIALWLDQSRSVWGGNGSTIRGISATDAYNVNVSFEYRF